MYLLEDELKKIIDHQTKLTCLVNPTDQTIYENLTTDLGLKSQDLLIVLEELLANSLEHGSLPIHYYFGQQLKYYIFCIEDFGSGIHTTIPKNSRLSDTKDKSSMSIIRLSLEEGISGTGTVGRGMGLYYLSKLIKEKGAEGLVASNSGLVIQRDNYFIEKPLVQDIKRNLVIFQIHQKELGL